MGAGKILEALVSDFFFKPLFFFIKSSCVLVESKVFFFFLKVQLVLTEL